MGVCVFFGFFAGWNNWLDVQSVFVLMVLLLEVAGFLLDVPLVVLKVHEVLSTHRQPHMWSEQTQTLTVYMKVIHSKQLHLVVFFYCYEHYRWSKLYNNTYYVAVLSNLEFVQEKANISGFLPRSKIHQLSPLNTCYSH